MVGHPYTTAAGKNAHIRAVLVAQPTATEVHLWRARARRGEARMICEEASDSYRLKANPNTLTPTASTTRIKSANNSPSEFMILSDHTPRGRADLSLGIRAE